MQQRKLTAAVALQFPSRILKATIEDSATLTAGQALCGQQTSEREREHERESKSERETKKEKEREREKEAAAAAAVVGADASTRAK